MDEQQRRDWSRFHELRLAEKARALDLAEKREFARGWDQVLQHVDSGNLAVPRDMRIAFEVLRQSAHNKLHAAVFQALSPAEGCREHPELAGAYALDAALGKQLVSTRFTDDERQIARERVRRNIVASLEKGKYPRLGESMEEIFPRPEAKSPRD